MAEDNLKNETSKIPGINNSGEEKRSGSWEYQVDNALFSIDSYFSDLLENESISFSLGKKELEQFIHPNDYHYFIQNLNTLVKGRTNHFSATIRLKKGHNQYRKAIIKSGLVIRDENNHPQMINGSIRLIAGNEIQRSQICNTEKCYRKLITAIPGVSLMVFDRNLEIQLYEGSKKEFMQKDDPVEGMTIYELFPKRMINLLEPVFFRALKGETTSFDHEYLHNIFRRHIFPLRNDKGEIENGMLITVDISSSKKIEKALTSSLAWYRSIIEGFEEGQAILENNRLIYASPAYHHWFGFEIMQGMTFEQVAEAIHPDDIEYVTSMFNSGKKNQTGNQQYQYRIIRADGSIIWLEDHLRYNYNREGKLVRTIISTQNISVFRKTEAKNAELLKELEFHQQIHDVLGEGIALLDNQQRFVFANPATGNIFETKTDVLVYTSLEDYRIEDYTGPGAETTSLQEESRTTYFIVIRTEKGNRKILRYHLFPFFLQSNLFANLAVFRDITHETELISQNSLLEEIISVSGIGYIMIKPTERHIEINEWITTRLGYQVKDLKKLSPYSLLDKLLPAGDADAFKKALHEDAAGKVITKKGLVTDSRDHSFPCIISMRRRSGTERKPGEIILTLQEQPMEQNPDI